jgi:ParB-like chromosome segregation protein Spo0J
MKEIIFRIPTVVDIELLYANHWNPNKMPKKEMDLLGECIMTYGFLFPIVVCATQAGVNFMIGETEFTTKDGYMIIDGFHRFEKLKQLKSEKAMVVVLDIPVEQAIQLTVLMNRIKGMHSVEKMATLVTLLTSSPKLEDIEVCKNLGMEAEEFIRLRQQIGIASSYKNHEFTKSWYVK